MDKAKHVLTAMTERRR